MFKFIAETKLVEGFSSNSLQSLQKEGISWGGLRAVAELVFSKGTLVLKGRRYQKNNKEGLKVSHPCVNLSYPALRPGQDSSWFDKFTPRFLTTALSFHLFVPLEMPSPPLSEFVQILPIFKDHLKYLFIQEPLSPPTIRESITLSFESLLPHACTSLMWLVN